MSKPPYILIIDDDTDDVDFLTDAFKSAYPAADIAHCKDGKQAIAFLHSVSDSAHCPDVVFLDLHLPGKNGYETLVELRESGECDTIPVIMVSTSSHESEAERCRRAGCADYFSKPSSLKGYGEIIERSMAHVARIRSAQ